MDVCSDDSRNAHCWYANRAQKNYIYQWYRVNGIGSCALGAIILMMHVYNERMLEMCGQYEKVFNVLLSIDRNGLRSHIPGNSNVNLYDFRAACAAYEISCWLQAYALRGWSWFNKWLFKSIDQSDYSTTSDIQHNLRHWNVELIW